MRLRAPVYGHQLILEIRRTGGMIGKADRDSDGFELFPTVFHVNRVNSPRESGEPSSQTQPVVTHSNDFDGDSEDEVVLIVTGGIMLPISKCTS